MVWFFCWSWPWKIDATVLRVTRYYVSCRPPHSKHFCIMLQPSIVLTCHENSVEIFLNCCRKWWQQSKYGKEIDTNRWWFSALELGFSNIPVFRAFLAPGPGATTIQRQVMARLRGRCAAKPKKTPWPGRKPRPRHKRRCEKMEFDTFWWDFFLWVGSLFGIEPLIYSCSKTDCSCRYYIFVDIHSFLNFENQPKRSGWNFSANPLRQWSNNSLRRWDRPAIDGNGNQLRS